MNEDKINHSFYSIKGKAHSNFIYLSRHKKPKKCFKGYIITLSDSVPHGIMDVKSISNFKKG